MVNNKPNTLPDGFTLLANSPYARDAWDGGRGGPTCHHITSADVLACAGDAPWHGLGYLAGEADLTVRSARQLMATYEPRLAPAQDVYRGGYTCSPRDRVVLAQDDYILGHVKDGYNLLAWDTLLQGIGQIVGDYNDSRLASVGTLDGGKTRFASWVMAAYTPPVGDARAGKVWFGNLRENITGGGSLKMSVAAFRSVCHNTSTLAIATGNNVVSIRHDQRHADNWQLECRAYAALNAQVERESQVEHELAAWAPTIETVGQLLDYLMPPVSTGDAADLRLNRSREMLAASLLNSPGGASDYGMSGYTLLEGVSHYSTLQAQKVRLKGDLSLLSPADQENERKGKVAFGAAESELYSRAASFIADHARADKVLTLA